MLHDMDGMEVSCIVYVKDDTIVQQEGAKICVLTVTSFGMAMLTVQCDLVFDVCFM